MSAEFSNKYQEILFDNFISIVKQNLMFQTQIQLTEIAVKERDELKEKYDKTLKDFNEAKNEIAHLKPFKNKVVDNNTNLEDTKRIQGALNDSMKKINVLKEQFEELKKYTTVLESLIPPTKLKKIKPVVEKQKSEVVIDTIKTQSQQPQEVLVETQEPKLDNISTF